MAAKRILVYQNGDAFFPGHQLVVTQRHYPTMEAFLYEVTSAVQASLAVRALYTLSDATLSPTWLTYRMEGSMWLLALSNSTSSTIYLLEGNTQVGRTGNNMSLPCLSAHVIGPLDSGYQQILPATSNCTLEGLPLSTGTALVNGHYYLAVGEVQGPPLYGAAGAQPLSVQGLLVQGHKALVAQPSPKEPGETEPSTFYGSSQQSLQPWNKLPALGHIRLGA